MDSLWPASPTRQSANTNTRGLLTLASGFTLYHWVFRNEENKLFYPALPVKNSPIFNVSASTQLRFKLRPVSPPTSAAADSRGAKRFSQSQAFTLVALSVVSQDWLMFIATTANHIHRCAGGPATGTCGQVLFVLLCVNGIKVKTQLVLFDNLIKKSVNIILFHTLAKEPCISCHSNAWKEICPYEFLNFLSSFVDLFHCQGEK